jgi:hypothetical protein
MLDSNRNSIRCAGLPRSIKCGEIGRDWSQFTHCRMRPVKQTIKRILSEGGVTCLADFGATNHFGLWLMILDFPQSTETRSILSSQIVLQAPAIRLA